MAVITVPRRLYTQPQGAVEVDWGNPLSRDLRCLLNTAIGPVELVARKAWQQLNASGLATPCPGGLYFPGVASSTGTSVVGWLGPERSTGSDTAVRYEPTAPPATIFAVGFEQSTSLGNRGGQIQRPNGSGVAAWATGWRNDVSVRGARAYVNTSGGTLTLDTSSGIEFDPRGRVCVSVLVIGTTNSTVYAGYIGGRPLSTKTGATPSGNFTYAYDTGVHRTISYGGGYGQSGSPLTAGVAWREWSEAEVLEYFRNPWQLFRPTYRRIYLPTAGGTSYDISGDVRDEALTTGTIGRETPVLGTTADEAAVAGVIARSTPVVGDVLDDGAVAGSLGRSTAIRGDDLDEGYATGDVTVGGAQTVDVTAGVVANAYCTGSLGVTPYFPWAIRVAPGMRTTRAVKLRGTPR